MGEFVFATVLQIGRIAKETSGLLNGLVDGKRVIVCVIFLVRNVSCIIGKSGKASRLTST